MYLLLLSIGFAEEFQLQEQKTESPVLRNYINMRMGVSSATTNGHPSLCLEVGLPNQLSIESCGTGYGFVHRDPGIDFVHFRGKYSLFRSDLSRSVLSGQVGAGFAEIQVSEDQYGFQFGGTGSGHETAGPEVNGTAQWVRQVGKRSEIVVDGNVGIAYFHHAPSLSLPQSQWFPFAECSVGVGW